MARRVRDGVAGGGQGRTGERGSRARQREEGGRRGGDHLFFRNTLRGLVLGNKGRAKGRTPKSRMFLGFEFARKAARRGGSPGRLSSFFSEYLARIGSGSKGRAIGRLTWERLSARLPFVPQDEKPCPDKIRLRRFGALKRMWACGGRGSRARRREKVERHGRGAFVVRGASFLDARSWRLEA